MNFVGSLVRHGRSHQPPTKDRTDPTGLRYVLVEYQPSCTVNEFLASERGGLENSAWGFYRVTTFLSGFKHARLVVLDRADDGSTFKGSVWDIGSDFNNDRAIEPYFGDRWVFDKTSTFVLFGFTRFSDREVTAQGKATLTNPFGRKCRKLTWLFSEGLCQAASAIHIAVQQLREVFPPGR